MHGTNSKSGSKYFILLNLAIKALERLTDAEGGIIDILGDSELLYTPL
jgi:hypothetical protein